jgi:hypothetical protein
MSKESFFPRLWRIIPPFGMKRTWKHNLNRWFRRRGGLPASARVPRTSHPAWRSGAFARSRFGRQETKHNLQRWLRLAAMGGLVVLALWACWQSWLGLGVFNN